MGCITDLDQCILINPTMMDAFYLRGKYQYEFGRYNKAIQDLNIYILNVTDDASAFAIRGECYSKQNEYSLAARDYTRAITIEDNNPVYYFDRGFFYIQLEEYESARLDFKKAIFYNHLDAKLAYFNLGIAEYRLGNKDDACVYWQKAQEVGFEYITKYCN